MRRNFYLIRSVGTGLVTKIAGALVVFAGLPLVAARLSTTDYAVFLAAMSLTSAVTLIYGALYTLCVRQISTAIVSGSEKIVIEVVNKTIGAYLTAFVLNVIPIVLIARFNNSFPAAQMFIIGMLFLASLQGLVQWGEVYWVAIRCDHISNAWNFIGNLATVAVLFLFKSNKLWFAGLAFFGIQTLVNTTIFIHLYVRKKLVLHPTFNVSELKRSILDIYPLLLNSASDYGKVFGSGDIVLLFAGPVAYAKYQTLILMIARLINPISLVARPLLPAYIEAIENRDEKWLDRARKILVTIPLRVYSVVIAFAIALCFVLAGQVIYKRGSYEFNCYEAAGGLLFLGGHAIVVLLAPFFIAKHRDAVVFAWSNVIGVTVGLTAGVAAIKMFGEPGMLVLFGAVLGCGAMVASVYASRNLLLLRPKLLENRVTLKSVHQAV